MATNPCRYCDSAASGFLGMLVGALAFAALIAFAGCKKPRSPELQRFIDKYNEIQEEMTEDEVDRLMKDYPSGTTNLEREDKQSDGRPLKRKSTFKKTYNNKLGATEGDYYIEVYFDEDGRVVGKGRGDWLS